MVTVKKFEMLEDISYNLRNQAPSYESSKIDHSNSKLDNNSISGRKSVSIENKINNSLNPNNIKIFSAEMEIDFISTVDNHLMVFKLKNIIKKVNELEDQSLKRKKTFGLDTLVGVKLKAKNLFKKKLFEKSKQEKNNLFVKEKYTKKSSISQNLKYMNKESYQILRKNSFTISKEILSEISNPEKSQIVKESNEENETQLLTYIAQTYTELHTKQFFNNNEKIDKKDNEKEFKKSIDSFSSQDHLTQSEINRSSKLTRSASQHNVTIIFL